MIHDQYQAQCKYLIKLVYRSISNSTMVNHVGNKIYHPILLKVLFPSGYLSTNIAVIAGSIKYSNEKLLLVAYGSSRTGYSINFNSTTINPTSQVIICSNKNTSWASLIFSRGIHKINPKTERIQTEISTTRSSNIIKLIPRLRYTTSIPTCSEGRP